MSPVRTEQGTDRPFADLVDVARQFEPERYVAATLAPASIRLALIALAAYAADLQRIPATATQPLLGEIRLQWWRDTLELIDKGGRVGSPLADALADAIRAHALPVAMLAAMSEARAWDLYDDPIPDQASLDGYLAKTQAIPFELALRMVGVSAGDAGAISLPAGRVFGMTRLLAQLPASLSAGRMPLPVTLLSSHGLTMENLMEKGDSAAARAVVSDLVEEIRAELKRLRPRIAALPHLQRVPMLPLAVVSPYLAAIQRPGRNPSRDIADLAPLTRVWRIAIARVLGRF